MGEARQTRHFGVEHVDVLVVEPIRHEQDGGTAGQRAARPLAVELRQCCTDARAARPVGHKLRDGLHGDIRITLAQLPGDIRQPRAKQESLDALPRLHQRMAVVQHGA
ncbi:Uncharacterised protein [Ralstonia pickettii]|nr:Uncharacterised protein [Ralstonia pickettii]